MIEAMKHALAALEDIFGKNKVDVGAINALRQAIEQAEKQKPVAWGVPNTRITESQPFMVLLHSTEGCQYPEMLVPLYTTPQPKREWVSLTDAEIEEFDYYARDLVMDIEKALKERNT